MGNLLGKLSELFKLETSHQKQRRILLLGLDAAGKTTIVNHMKFGSHSHTVPTIGFQCEEIKIPGTNINFIMWDVGGQEKFRRLWSEYFLNAGGVMFVVDSTDRERFNEAREEFYNVMNHEDLENVPFVLLANKQDMPSAANAFELTECFDLEKIACRGHKYRVRETTAATGEGLLPAFEDMAKLAKEFIDDYRS